MTEQRRRPDGTAPAAAVEAGERYTRQILETAYDAFISLDCAGMITGWNAQATAVFGWSRDEALGRELAELLIPELRRDAHRRGIERFLATGEETMLGRRLELMVLHRDGYEFLAELTISALETADGYAFHAFLRDVTERRREQAELALARDEALAASRMKSMFVANVSHEIRTPMNGVIGITELLLGTDLDTEQREYAEMILSSGEALLGVIDDILDLSKIEAGKLDLDPTDFDPGAAVERACGMLAARAHQKGLELVVAIDPAVPALLHGDAARLRQVIANLVSNAIKFTARGEVVVRATSHPARDATATLRVEVSDTGIGIDRRALARVFTPFAQADGSTTRRYGGTGLGLAISRELIELMGGRLDADSSPGLGSRFWFSVALADADHGGSAPAERHELTGLRVLVVDGSAASRELLESQLDGWEMRCDVVAGADRAMELLVSAARAGQPYALLLLDAGVPGGAELAHVVRAHPELDGMRLALLAPGGRAGRAEAGAVDGVLSKPLRRSRLYEELVTVVTGREPAAARGRAPAGGASAAARRGSDVLVVEDGKVNQTVAIQMLDSCGFRAHVASNGVEALQALSTRSFAAVLMDCQMPELDGYETTREIRRRELHGSRVPIIAMTAGSMQGERERCLAAGMDDYLTKPLRNRVLRDALARWVPETSDRGLELLDEPVLAELAQLGGAVLSTLLSAYAGEAQTDLAQLEGAVGRGDMTAARDTAHRLKGTSATVGATRVSQLASELEVAAGSGHAPAAGELLQALCGAVHETAETLRGRLAPPTGVGA